MSRPVAGGIFGHIYRRNLWNGIESRSGPGSGSASTERMAAEITALVAELGVASVLDVGCGDGFWMPELPGYVGVDAAAEAVELARRRHPDRRYLVLDASREPLPPAELAISRDAMQHLSLADGVALLGAIRAAGARWLLASTYLGGQNRDVATGAYFEPDLSAAPFDLGPPLRLLFDGWSWEHPISVRDGRKHLGLWRLDARG